MRGVMKGNIALFRYIFTILILGVVVSFSSCGGGGGGGSGEYTGNSTAAQDNILMLDGVDDIAEASSSVFPTSTSLESFTVEAWIYPLEAGSAIAMDDAYELILYLDVSAANFGVGIKFGLWWSDCSSVDGVIEFRDVSLHQWNHIAAMFDASQKEGTIAINGKLGTPFSLPGNALCSDKDFNFFVGDEFKGMIYDVRVSSGVRYTSDFTPSETLTSDSYTRGLWHFNETAGSTSFVDSSGNGHTLTGLNGAMTEAK